MRVSILAASVWGPGLEGWEASRAVLAGQADHVPGELLPTAPAMLSPTERRRTSLVVRLALQVAGEATARAGVAPGGLRSVFATSNGDGVVVHAILDSLATGDGQVSPTQFHNSVHNAAAGYWTIGTGSRQPATCIGCHDGTAGMALLKAAAEVVVEGEPALLVVYDAPMPAPFHVKRQTEHGFAAAFVLAPPGDARAVADLTVAFSPEPAVERINLAGATLLALARSNPAARVLPLLSALARDASGTSVLTILDGHVSVTVTPCSTAGRSPR